MIYLYIYLILGLISYFVIRYMLIKASKNDECSYWDWAGFILAIFVSIIAPLVSPVIVLFVFGESLFKKTPCITFPKWL